MKGLAFIVCLTFLALAARAREFRLYAALLGDTPVELSDGARWMMDRGDVFPVLMYKDSQTRVVLQLAGATFMTETKRVRILKDEEVAPGLVIYRKNVELYLKSKADKWRAAHEPSKQEAAAAKP